MDILKRVRNNTQMLEYKPTPKFIPIMKTKLFTLICAVLASAAVQINANQFWPIIMDGQTLEANAANMAASFAPNEVDQWLYIWDGTYTAGDGAGLNSMGNAEGYLSLVVGGAGWSGLGFCLTESGTGWQDVEALRQAIVASPDDYFLHLAIKSTDNKSHAFYIFGTETTKFVLGSHSVYDGEVYADFDRDGAWHEFLIPMSRFSNALANTQCTGGVNVFVVLSEGVQGTQLNLDAVYFCDKEFALNESGTVVLEQKELGVQYVGNDEEELHHETITLHVPVAPEIEGFEFIEWEIAGGKLEEGLVLQAVYKSNTGLKSNVVNTGDPAQKLIRRGNVYILRGGKTYTAQGQEVK